jgi:hypothetical protein
MRLIKIAFTVLLLQQLQSIKPIDNSRKNNIANIKYKNQQSEKEEPVDLSNMRYIKLFPLQFQVGHNLNQKEVGTQTDNNPPQSLVGMCYDIKNLILGAKGMMLGRLALIYLTIGKYIISLLSDYNSKLKSIANDDLFIICSTLNDEEFEQFVNCEYKKYSITALAKVKSSLLCVKSHINKIYKTIPNCMLSIDAAFVLLNEKTVLQRLNKLTYEAKMPASNY